MPYQNPYQTYSYPWGGITPSPTWMLQQPTITQPITQPVQQPYVGTNAYQPRFQVGRIVESPEEITASDVPMDGSVRLFPTGDGSAIYRKEWDGNGRLNTVRYISDTTPAPSEPSFEDLTMQRFDRIEALLERRDTTRRNNQRRDKEAGSSDDN